jgi:hypothetical protein
MGIEYKKSLAIFTENVSVEDAEGLLDWLVKNPKGKINLAACEHIHAANLQILMVTKPTIASEPKDENLQIWLNWALKYPV